MNSDTCPGVFIMTPPLRARIALAACLACVILLLFGTQATWAQGTRGEARVAVYADFIGGAASTDAVMIHLVNVDDKTTLQKIADTLSEKFNTTAIEHEFVRGEEPFLEPTEVGMTFRMKVVPRGEGYLPIAPFIESFAPYASRLRIIYMVQGPFRYRGYQQYSHRDVEFAFDKPDISDAGTPHQRAFFSVDVNIKNPNLESLTLAPYPEEDAKRRNTRLWSFLAIVLGMGIVGTGVGLLLARLLARYRTAEPVEQGDKGGSHD